MARAARPGSHSQLSGGNAAVRAPPAGGSSADRALSGSNVSRAPASSSSSSSAGLRASASSAQFSSLMDLIHIAEEKTDLDGQDAALRQSRTFAAPSSTAAQPAASRSSQSRPLSAAALISPRSLAASSTSDSPERGGKGAFTFNTASSAASNSSHAASSDSAATKSSTPRSLQVGTGAAASPTSSGSPYSARFATPSPSPLPSPSNAASATAAGARSTGLVSPSPRASSGLPSSSPTLSKNPSQSSYTSSISAAPSSGTSTFSGLSGLDALKQKLVALKTDLASKDSQVASLRSQLSDLQLQMTSQSTRASEQLANQKKEYEQLLASSQNFVEKVLNEKKDLNSQVSTLASQLEALSADSRKRENEFQRTTLAAEIKKAKDQWISAERVARESFLAHRTKQIKAETVAALEPEVAKTLARAKEERKELEETLNRKMNQSLADARADHDALVASIRKQHLTALEHAREDERVQSQKRLRECVEKYDSMMQDQRARHVAELEEERARLSTTSSTLQSAIENALLQQRQEHLVAIAKAKDSAQAELEDCNRRHQLELAREREKATIEKESWTALMLAKLQREQEQRLAAAKKALSTAHEEEIAMLVKRMGEESEKQTREVVAQYEKRIEALRRQTTSDVTSSKRSADDTAAKLASLQQAHTALEERARVSAQRVTELQALLSDKSAALDTAQRELGRLEVQLANAQKDAAEQFSSEKAQLRVQFKSLQAKLEEGAKRLAAASSSSDARVASALAERDAQHASALEAMQTRVKELLAKKEGVIEALKTQVAAAEQDAQRARSELERQRREIMEHINA